MAKMGVIGEALEVLAEETEKGMQTAKQQITGKPVNQQATNPQLQQQAQKTQQVAAAAQQQQPPSDQPKAPEEVPTDLKQPNESAEKSQDETKTFLKGIYGSTPELTEAEIEKKKLEDKQKEEALRQQLHSQYYQNLTNPQKKQEEERPQEKNEREEEKKKEAFALEEEKKQKEELPHIVTKDEGSKEKLRGVSG